MDLIVSNIMMKVAIIAQNVLLIASGFDWKCRWPLEVIRKYK